MSDKTALGDRMKWYESRYTNDQFMPMAPVLARLDGRAFHTFTKGLKRPYDERLTRLMVETTKYLVKDTNARCGYTQSDEITLCWLAEEWESEIYFDGKLQKMNSILSSLCSSYFNLRAEEFLPEKMAAINEWKANPTGMPPNIPVFDCRVFQVPVNYEAVNCFIWREQDATRNSVQMAAQAHFEHDECQNKNKSDLQEMLFSQRGINWNNYPAFFKRGTYVRKRVLERPFSAEELSALPEKHAARTNPDLKIKRTVVMEEELPPLARIANRDEVVLFGADPVLNTEEQSDV